MRGNTLTNGRDKPTVGQKDCSGMGMTQDITELEQRITAAFDRMDRGLEAAARARRAAQEAVGPSALEMANLGQDTDTAPPMPALVRALELAKSAADDWADRYAKLQAQMGEETLTLASEVARLTDELTAARALIEPITISPAQGAREDIDELTARIAAQEAELETLRAARAADASELGELIAQLSPLVEEASHV
ncbi:MAG: hypothetical protein U5N55_09745 [Cypionkella sp.]|nr:hypothetical protein [Cypionkella sp.]